MTIATRTADPAPTAPPEGAAAWTDAVLAAMLFAIDPAGCGGLIVEGHAGPVRDRFLSLVTALLPAGTPIRRLPAGITDGRLIGGLDLTATLSSGRPVAERGLLAEIDGGVLIVPMAERLAAGTVARLAAALDSGEVVVERDGLARRWPARFGVIALDESLADEEPVAAPLAERLAFRVDLSPVSMRDIDADGPDPADILDARADRPKVVLPDALAEAIGACAAAFGCGSIRADLLTAAVAKASAALLAARTVAETDVETAARLVLVPRATRMPVSEQEMQAAEPPPPPPPDEANRDPSPAPATDQPLAERVVEAVRAAVPADLLAELQARAASPRRSTADSRGGPPARSTARGRPIGALPGDPRRGPRLDLVETLRAAAPWQRLRAREAGPETAGPEKAGPRIRIAREDWRVQRLEHRTRTTTIFVVDASGSSALHRLAEAKGAVELLLADCYVRRDRVAVIAFRGKTADLIVPPTSSLTRAKACMAGLPGGGGTPLAAALDAAAALADAVRRKGDTPLVVLLTDGQANVARDGAGGRSKAEADAAAAARLLRATGVTALVVDTAPRPSPRARTLADHAGARYLALPQADAASLGRVVKAAHG